MSIKKFNNFINEGVKQYLKPKPEDEILKSVWEKLKELSPIQQLDYISKNDLKKTIPQDYITKLSNEIIEDIKDKPLQGKLHTIFNNNLTDFFIIEQKKQLIQQVIEICNDISVHKNILYVHNEGWNFKLFINADNLETNLVGLYAANAVWTTIKKLI